MDISWTIWKSINAGWYIYIMDRVFGKQREYIANLFDLILHTRVKMQTVNKLRSDPESCMQQINMNESLLVK